MAGLEKALFNLKFTAKQLNRQAAKANKDEQTEKAKLKKAIQQGHSDIAKIYAQNAIRKKNENLNLLRLGSRIDAVSSKVQTAVTMRQVTGSMANVVKGMDSAMKSMDLEKISAVMDKFETQFEDLDVATGYYENATSSATATGTPQEDVDKLMNQVADEAGVELSQEMQGATPANDLKAQPEEEREDKLDRYKSRAREQRFGQADSYRDTRGDTILPTHNKPNTETGGLNEKSNGRGSPSGSSASKRRDGGLGGANNGGGGVGDYFGDVEASTSNDTEDAISKTAPPPAPPPDKSEDAGTGDATIEPTKGNNKPPITDRMKAGSKRFVVHMKNAILNSWINVLLVFVPIGIIVEAIGLSPTIIFAMNAVAVVPLAGLLAYATEAVAARLGDTLGALLNVSFGNAVELIIFIIALVKNEIQVVQAALLGSILANLLLILGMAFLLGGLRYREQVYNSTVTQMSACLLSLSVMSLLLPTAFYQSFKRSNAALADAQVLKVSRGTSVILLLVYILYLLFQLKSHAYLYESTPQAIIDEESHPGVLADIMNSSSSSSDSSSSDSSDSDTSGSGSIINTGKKIKRAFKNRRRRKSSASTSTTVSAKNSAISSPSATVNQQASGHWVSQGASRRGSALEAVVSADDADADHEDNTGNGPRVRDFVTEKPLTSENGKSSVRKKNRKKHSKKHHKKGRAQHEEKEAAEAIEINRLDEVTEESSTKEKPSQPRTVGFADDVAIGESTPTSHLPAVKSSFNMRQLSSRTNLPRPALPKMLSNNVFVTPAPVPTPTPRPTAAARSQSRGIGLRRTSSLPDRLNREASSTPSHHHATQHSSRTGPLPPFQHQRQQLRKARSDDDAVGLDGNEDEAELQMSRTAAVVLLVVTTALVAVCAEFLVDAIPEMVEQSDTVSQAFVGLIILPIVGNAAEHVTAVTVAAKNKMDLAIGVAVGSSIQIALFVTPVVVLLGWILGTEMSLYFNIFETISLFVSVFVVNFLVLDGRSNYLEGSLLIAAYVIIALGAFFYPSSDNQSAVGGVGGGGE
ncbi:hypothetical protein LTR37_010067 [Vermiconidia calcicola]|uniref:Uncharacterized protein n=1 Tax=Vermiconidia calcicola TaxID=1690605 RepID=A0ACC3N6T2_9PEZI|nr:hypothetical protein LTR37_010067 [Vermiconidia calcicola]